VLPYRLTAPICAWSGGTAIAAGDLQFKWRHSTTKSASWRPHLTITPKLQAASEYHSSADLGYRREPVTLGHSVRVGQQSMMIGREIDLNETVLARLEIGGYLHDIGKIGIRDAVLLKPGRLTPEEREAIQEHPSIGMSILEAVDLPAEVMQFVSGHHERLDGSGYPKGLSGPEVSVVARIAAVADMYDAVTTERPYRGPMDPEEALALLRSEAGRLLDPKLQMRWPRSNTNELRRAREPAARHPVAAEPAGPCASVVGKL
jgi:putative nucleotidyltransferase with HDIG domain